MATDIYSDDNGRRVVIRHKGPPGVGFPPGGSVGQLIRKVSSADYDMEWTPAPGGTGAIDGPSVATDGAFVLFDGTTGKLVQDSTRTLSYFATRTYADTKVDKITGKGLSQEDFTSALKTKLDALGTEHYLGTYADIDAAPTGNTEGDYVTVEVDGETLAFFAWDVTNTEWADISKNAGMTGAEIATALFKTAETYDKETCRIFTTAHLDAVNGAASQVFVNAVLSAAGFGTASYGHTEYFSLTGTTVAIASISDGLSNMVKCDVVTVVGAETVSFDSGSSTARMRYTASTVRLFNVEVVLSFDGASTDLFVLGVAKNGAVIASSRVLTKAATAGDISSVKISTIVSLTNNDYIEVFVGNTTATTGPQVHTLSITAIPA